MVLDIMRKSVDPFFSLITICYNEEKRINKTCKSISQQNFKNFEWIIIDGNSADRTLDVIKKYKDFFSKLISEKDNGRYHAMNKGIKNAKGKYLLFVNGGDYLQNKDVLQKVYDFIMKDNERNDIYCGDILLENGRIFSRIGNKLDKQFFIFKTIPHQASFIKYNLFKKYGNYDEKYEIVGDYDFWVRSILLGESSVKFLPFVISVFDLKGVGSSYKFYKKHIKERNDVLLKNHLINPFQAFLLKIVWASVALLKFLRVDNFLKKCFRKKNV